jgi:iterative type I PKS product template protein
MLISSRHGTGTQAGDGVEMESVTKVFAPASRQRRQDQPLYLGAVKANIGHGEAASGTNSLVKVLMMMQRDMIPANIGIKHKLNESFPQDLVQRQVFIPTVNTPFPRGKGRKIFLNNFSAAGGNTAILLEDGPKHERNGFKDPRTCHIVTVSARSIASLKRNIVELRDWLDDHPDADLPSLSYTTTARRIQHNYRIAFSVSKRSDLQASLQNQLKDSYSPIATAATKTAFCFTGQGSQYVALGKSLYEQVPSFKADIDGLIRLSLLQGFPSILPLIDGTDLTTVSPLVIQLGLSVVQVALARLWSSWGVNPSVVVGHSLGEYAALHIAGVISASDMILLVGTRAKLLIERCTRFTHGMLAVKADVDTVRSALGSKMPEIACINSPEETVLCGTIDIVSTLHDFLTTKGFRATKLNVPFAFHSMQVDPIMEAFKEAIDSVHFAPPTVPVLSPLTGEVVTAAGVFNAQYLVRHARETVNFLGAINNGYQQNIFNDKTAWVEIGAHPICLGLVRSSLKSIPVSAPSMRRNEDPWKTLTTSICSLYLAGVSVNFNEYHRYFNDAHRLLVLPTMSFDEKKYWLDYHNNWCLTKGEAPKITNKLPIIENKPRLSTTSCHKIVREELQPNSGTIVIQSNLAEPKLHAAVTGHLVNGSPLCPSSLYADMALTAADYLYKEIRPGASPAGMNVCAMEVHKPLIAEVPPPQDGQHLQLEASADLEQGVVRLVFRTVQPDGTLIRDLGHGLVKYEEVDAWKQEWSRVQFMVQTQIDMLRQKLEKGEAHKLLKGIAYKLFRSLVTYSRPYQGMEEVVMNAELAEATAKVRFATNSTDGDFFCAPYWIDSLAHISGFILNGSDVIDSSESVYISHGWNSIRFVRQLSADEEYTTYVRMLPAPGNVSVGDVYILHKDEIVGVVTGLKFQNVPRRALNVMVPPPKSTKFVLTAAPEKPQSSLPYAMPTVPTSTVSQQTNTKALTSSSDTPAVAAIKVPSSGSIVSKVMEIIAEETDLNASELVDEAAFENLGVDSLMSLTISARFREDLNLDISSTLFTDYPTIGEMKSFFGHQGKPTDSSIGTESHLPLQPVLTRSQDTAALSFHDSTWSSVPDSPEHHATPASSPATSIEDPLDRAITRSSALQRNMGSTYSVSSTSSMRDYDSVFTTRTVSTPFSEIDEPPSIPVRPIPKSMPSQSALSKTWNAVVPVLPPATSVLLQGSAKHATKMLFLLPDGSGSATSYVSIPNLAPDLKVYGLNCPFMKSPENYTCGIDEVTQLYLTEIRRRQPKGPYLLGGWSAGGVIAYEVARQFYLAGEQVETLLLIDSPCPVKLPPLPARLHIWFDKVGLLGTGKPGSTPSWLLPHFSATIKALSDYEPIKFPKGKAPRTITVWCTDGVCKNPGDPRPPPGDEPAPMKWLLNNRTDFGDNGWGQLVDTDNMEYYVMGGNHFTMMKPPFADALGKFIRLGLGYSEES